MYVSYEQTFKLKPDHIVIKLLIQIIIKSIYTLILEEENCQT